MGVKPPDKSSLTIIGKSIPRPDEVGGDARVRSPSGNEDAGAKEVDSFEVGSPGAAGEVRPTQRAGAEEALGASLTTPAVRHPSRDPLLRAATPLSVVSGEGWGETLNRHYGVALPPVLLERIVAAHESHVNQTPPKTILAPGLEGIYQEIRSEDPKRAGRIIERADLVLVEEGQPLEDVIRAHYGSMGDGDSTRINDDFLRVVTMAVKAVNGGSRYTHDSIIVALPKVADLGKLMDRIRSGIARVDARREEHRQQEEAPGAGATRIPGEAEKVACMGKAYEPEFGEKLGDVTAYVYREHLTRPGLSEAEAKQELAEIMLAVMRWNKMATMDLGTQPKMYWPGVEQLDAFRSAAPVQREVERFKKSSPVVWEGILLASEGAGLRAEVAKRVVVSHLGTSGDQLKAVDKAADTVLTMQLEELWADSRLTRMPCFGTVWYEEEFEDDEVYPGGLAARKPGESDQDYASRLFEDTLSPSELKEFINRPHYLLANHLGIMNRNGGFEPGQRAALQEGLERLGLVGPDGSLSAGYPELASEVDQATIDLVNRALELELELEPGETIDSFLERANWSTHGAEQVEVINHLWLWNVAAKLNISSLDEVPRVFGAGDSYEFIYLGGFLTLEEEELIALLYQAAEASSVVLESAPSYEKEEDFEPRSLEYLKRAGARVARYGVALDEMSEAQADRFDESMEQLVEYLTRLELREEEYQEKLIAASRVLASRILSGEDLGGPDKWFV